MSVPHSEFHEVWWIYSPINNREWAGLRIAHFRKSTDGAVICVITNEIDNARIGPRIWADVERTELWYKVKQIAIPTLPEVLAAALDIESLERDRA